MKVSARLKATTTNGYCPRIPQSCPKVATLKHVDNVERKAIRKPDAINISEINKSQFAFLAEALAASRQGMECFEFLVCLEGPMYCIFEL